MKMRNALAPYATAMLLGGACFIPDAVLAGGIRAKPAKAATVFDAQKRKRTKHKIGQSLTYSMHSSIRYQSERNQRRDDGVDDRADEYALYLGVVGRADLGRGLIAFGHGELDARSKITHARSYGLDARWSTKEAFVSLEVAPEARLTFGRMRFSDVNKWVADAAVDGVHFGHKTKTHVTEIAAFSGPSDVAGTYLMGHFGRARNKTRYGALALIERTGSDDRVHLAGYANAVGQQFSYELNLGAVAGNAANGKRAGIGFDIRTTHKFPGNKWNTQLMFGLAAGSAGYRQSGLHSNKTYNRGQAQVHRYGYVFQPDLSNLIVGSVAVGLRPSRSFSADLGLHVYAQASPSTIGPSARLSGATNGSSAFIGTEISLSGAWRTSKTTKVEFGIGHFNPGPAYVDQSAATRVYLRVSASF